MGLLDDAIREHLELKRRRGADAVELSLAEQDALGPARRGSLPPPPAEADYHAGSIGAGEPLDDEFYEDEFEADGDVYEDELVEAPPAPAPPPPAPMVAPRASASGDRSTALRYSGAAPFPTSKPRTAAPTAPAPSPSTQNTEEFAVPTHEPPQPPYQRPYEQPPLPPQPVYREPPPAYREPPRPPAPEILAVGEEPVEDILEDTPEFLEETPEHDRLWFEQRPPRDFDFDG